MNLEFECWWCAEKVIILNWAGESRPTTCKACADRKCTKCKEPISGSRYKVSHYRWFHVDCWLEESKQNDQMSQV